MKIAIVAELIAVMIIFAGAVVVGQGHQILALAGVGQ